MFEISLYFSAIVKPVSLGMYSLTSFISLSHQCRHYNMLPLEALYPDVYTDTFIFFLRSLCKIIWMNVHYFPNAPRMLTFRTLKIILTNISSVEETNADPNVVWAQSIHDVCVQIPGLLFEDRRGISILSVLTMVSINHFVSFHFNHF